MLPERCTISANGLRGTFGFCVDMRLFSLSIRSITVEIERALNSRHMCRRDDNQASSPSVG